MTTQTTALWKPAATRVVYLGELPPTRPVCTRRACLPHLFHAAAALDPDAPALLGDGGAQISYAELDRRSGLLAGYLRTLGVGPEVVVAICLDRPFDFVIAALAVWKAGGAYLPIDPRWPADRRQAIVDDAQASVLITRSSLAFRARYVVDIDFDAAAIAREPSLFTLQPLKRDHLACVIYSSGGARGVELTHGNLLNLVFWHRRAFGVTPSDRASHVAGIGFDGAMWELWPYLTAGAAVAMPSESIHTSPDRVREWFTTQSITIGFVPASLAEPLIACRWPRSTALRYLLTGADTLHRYPAAGLPFRLINHYGPAECTIVATSGEIPAEPEAVLPPIGAPVANTQIHVLDADRQPVAPGAIGEIYISGTGVARGYRNRVDLTAERFLENPFSIGRNARMYRTGDLGRLLPDGRLAFCGRAGELEKLRGRRIEPDEIVRVLDRHPAVMSSAVAVRGQGSSQRLVAYVVPTSAPDLTSSVLRAFLARQFPESLAPSVFVRLAELPLDSGGRLDRTALPDPSKENCLPGSDFREPVSPMERQVRAILHLESDDLSAVNGAELIVRVKQLFGVELDPRDLSRVRTVRALAAEIERFRLSQLDSMTEEEAARLMSLDADRQI